MRGGLHLQKNIQARIVPVDLGVTRRGQIVLAYMIICPHCKTANPDFAGSCSQCNTPLPLSDSETIQMVDPAAISTGSDFGPRYRIEALLGQGGMGRVYKAYDKELNRTVAIKVILRSAMGEADALNRFKQELVAESSRGRTPVNWTGGVVMAERVADAFRSMRGRWHGRVWPRGRHTNASKCRCTSQEE